MQEALGSTSPEQDGVAGSWGGRGDGWLAQGPQPQLRQGALCPLLPRGQAVSRGMGSALIKPPRFALTTDEDENGTAMPGPPQITSAPPGPAPRGGGARDVAPPLRHQRPAPLGEGRGLGSRS